jgi:hypothetical protein
VLLKIGASGLDERQVLLNISLGQRSSSLNVRTSTYECLLILVIAYAVNKIPAIILRRNITQNV